MDLVLLLVRGRHGAGPLTRCASRPARPAPAAHAAVPSERDGLAAPRAVVQRLRAHAFFEALHARQSFARSEVVPAKTTASGVVYERDVQCVAGAQAAEIRSHRRAPEIGFGGAVQHDAPRDRRAFEDREPYLHRLAAPRDERFEKALGKGGLLAAPTHRRFLEDLVITVDAVGAAMRRARDAAAIRLSGHAPELSIHARERRFDAVAEVDDRRLVIAARRA